MGRYILRFRGKGDIPPEEIERLKNRHGITIVDRSNQMLLVDSDGDDVMAMTSADWVVSAERTIAPPDHRPRILKKVEGGGK